MKKKIFAPIIAAYIVINKAIADYRNIIEENRAKKHNELQQLFDYVILYTPVSGDREKYEKVERFVKKYYDIQLSLVDKDYKKYDDFIKFIRNDWDCNHIPPANVKEITLELSKDYLIGNYRYEVYYMNPWWLRDFIVDQFEARVASMNPKCYSDGQCVMCGCQTTALQMAKKSCNAPCYPPLMNKKEWEAFKENGGGEIDGVKWKYFSKSHTFITKT